MCYMNRLVFWDKLNSFGLKHFSCCPPNTNVTDDGTCDRHPQRITSITGFSDSCRVNCGFSCGFVHRCIDLIVILTDYREGKGRLEYL